MKAAIYTAPPAEDVKDALAGEGENETPPTRAVKDCDLVMQGGIASGMVYPPALLSLYRQGYRFHNIGGTSAGAIAAGFAAAAEHGRDIGAQGRTGEGLQVEGGFQRLQVVQSLIGAAPEEGQPSFLRNLFRPDARTRPLMEAAFACVQKGSVRDKAVAVGRTLWTSLPGPVRTGMWRGAAVGLGFLLVFSLGAGLAGAGLAGTGGASSAGGAGRVAGLAVAVALLLAALALLAGAGALGALVGAVLALGKTLTVTLPQDNLFGICTGHAPGAEARKDGVLTDWMAWAVDYLAGRCDLEGARAAPDAGPLTFGDLAGPDPKEPVVQLKMVTSDLSQGQPYDLPFDDFLLLFQEDEMRQLFPESVVQALIAGSCQPPALDSAGKTPPPSPREHVTPPHGYHFVPERQALPVVFAMRLSLSVPVFISAVPLYTVMADALKDLAPEGVVALKREDLQRNWFSDGGLCSNFPIHFFDGWLPRWPTFGINLLSLYQDTGMSKAEKQKAARARVSAPVRATGGLASPRHLGASAQMAMTKMTKMTINPATGRMAADPPGIDPHDVPVRLPRADDPISAEWTDLTALFPFCFSVLTTAKNWQDTLAAQLPSYRERIVQVRLASDTGGLNLNMTQAQIAQITALGRQAGAALQDYPVPHHQWVRYQVLMGQLEKQLQDMRETPWAPPGAPDPSVPPPAVEFRVDYVALGREQLATQNLPADDPTRFPYVRPAPWPAQTEAIMAELKCLIAGWQPRTFGEGSPLPEPTLRVTPDI